MQIAKRIKKAFNSYFFNILLIVFISYFVLKITFKFSDVEELISLFKNAKLFYLILALLFVFLWQWLVGAALTLITRLTHPKYRYRDGFLNALVAALFHDITPSASGGQIAQVFVFRKQGVDLADSSSALWLEFIVYQSCLTIISLIFILLKFHYFYSQFSNMYIFVLIGFLINSAIIVFMYGFARFEKLHKWLITRGVELGCKFHIIKDPESVVNKVNLEAAKFRKETIYMQKNPKVISVAFVLVVLRLLVYYSIPFVILMALGVKFSFSLLLDSIVMSSFVSIASGMIPIPGASGGSEAIFVMMFSNLVSSSVATGAMLIWRGVTYYLMILIGLIAFVTYKLKRPREC